MGGAVAALTEVDANRRNKMMGSFNAAASAAAPGREATDAVAKVSRASDRTFKEPWPHAEVVDPFVQHGLSI